MTDFRTIYDRFEISASKDGMSQIYAAVYLDADGRVSLVLKSFGYAYSDSKIIDTDINTAAVLRQIADALDKAYDSRSEQEWEHACQREEAVELMPQIPGEVA